MTDGLEPKRLWLGFGCAAIVGILGLAMGLMLLMAQAVVGAAFW